MKHTLTVFVFLTLAGLAPASAQIVVDHAPYPFGGTTSDLAFRDNFDQPQWQQAADDFRLPGTADVLAINWWAWYRADNPPEDESIRIRLYANRDMQDLPGKILYDQVIANPSRTITGRRISVFDLPREFRFHASLPVPISVAPDRLYWLEITQLDDVDSWYFAESARVEADGCAIVNGIVGDWRRSTATSDLAFQLIVPEPASVAFALLGIVLLARRRRLCGTAMQN